MRNFTYEAWPARVVFGVGVLNQAPDEVSRLGAKALVLCTPEQRSTAEEVRLALGDRAVGVFDRATMHVPVEISKAAQKEAQRLDADVYVAVGGGSTIGLAKAIALETGLPILAIPTTYAGSEMTPIWGLTENSLKKTGRDAKVLPKTVIYDPKLTLSLPPSLSATSGLNAMAHAVEALYAENRNPIISMIAEESIRALSQSLPGILKNPSDLKVRGEAQYGAWLAGMALGSVGMALHHKICHTLGGRFNLPHSEVHTVMLPHVTAYNREAAPEGIARVARALGHSDAAVGLFDLEIALGTPTKLADIGMRHEDLDLAADLATRNPYFNPRPIDRNSIRKLLDEAYFGRRPESVIR